MEKTSVSKSGEYSGGNNLQFSFSRTAGSPWNRLLSINPSRGCISRQGSSYRTWGTLAASESFNWTSVLILLPATAARSHFFANFKEDHLKPWQRRRRLTPIVNFCLGLRHRVLAYIQQLFF
jgi:hypothetical protein